MRKTRRRDLFQFSWRVPECGYRFEKRPSVGANGEIGQKKRCLVYAADVTRFKTTHPLEDESGLFRQFAEVKLDEQSMTVFANKFGWLGLNGSFISDRNQWINGEPVESWVDEISTIHRLVDLWDQLCSKDQKATETYLRERLTFTKELVKIRFDDGDDPVAFRDAADFHLLHEDDPVGAGWIYLGRKLNDRLNRYDLKGRLMHDRHADRELTLFITPPTLISAIYFQFARAIDGNHQYRICDYCLEPFEVGGATGKNKQAKFCCDSHRAAYGAAHPKKKSKSGRRAK